MNTNQIEEQLKVQVNNEIAEHVDSFISRIEVLNEKHGAPSFYDLKDNDEKLSTLRKIDVRRVLINMLKESHGERMLRTKTNELLKKLELL